MQSFKKRGHNRRPSLNKSMPVSCLLENFSFSPKMNLQSIASDGETPHFECPPLIFHNTDDDDDDDNNCDYNINHIDNDGMEVNDGIPLIQRNATNIESLPSITIRDTTTYNSNCSDRQFYQQSDSLPNVLINIDNKKEKIPIDHRDSDSDSESNRHRFLSNMICDNSTRSTINSEVSDCRNDKQPTVDVDYCVSDKKSDQLTVTEALTKMSLLTSPAARRRLAARKIEMDIGNAGAEHDPEYVPSKQLLVYLVRMGSFNSAPKINNADTQDDYVDIPKGLSPNGLLQHCMLMRGENRPKLLQRNFIKPLNGMVSNDITNGVRVLQLNSVSKDQILVCSEPVSSPNHLRLLQWNILSQSLGQNNDGFVCCPEEALTWECRKYLIIQEIIQNDPDIICLQEVDHFKFLQSVLGTQNYDGIFFPKPDSPCLYICENNGPDGCAIFYKTNKYQLIDYHTKILEVWRVQSNQVAIAANFRVTETGKEFAVCTTHLKARNGALLSKLRNEQGKDLIEFASNVAVNKPIIICGDFNAEPWEPVYSTILNHKELSLSSAYADMQAAVESQSTNDSKPDDIDSQQRADKLATFEPPFTTWKIREDGEVCHTIDYIFYSQDKFKINNCLMFPDDSEIGKERTPSFKYPSDHFSLVCDFEFCSSDDDTLAHPM